MSEGYKIKSKMIEHYSRIRYANIEVPFNHKKNPISHGVDVLAHFVGVIGYRRPLLEFGLSGFTCISLGVILGFLAFSQYYLTGKFEFFSLPVVG